MQRAFTGIRYSHFPILILVAYGLCMFYNAHKMFRGIYIYIIRSTHLTRIFIHYYTKCCILQILMNINVDVFDWHWYVTLG